jgi:YVTN family beta-propeller protein
VLGRGPFLANPVGAGDAVVVADTHGTVTALDPVSGFVHWQRSLGRLPMLLATEESGRYVGVLDRSGSASLIDVATGHVVASAPIGAQPVGVAVYVDHGQPVLVVADEAAVRAYRPDGDDTELVYRTDVEVSAGPAVHGSGVVVAAANGQVLSIDQDGRTHRRFVADSGLERLVVGGDTAVGTNGDDAYFIDVDDLRIRAVVHDDADAITVGTFGVDPVFTLTAHEGRVTVRAADGSELRTVHAPVVSEPPPGYGNLPVPAQPLRAAAVSVDGAVWVPAVTGPLYYRSGS